MSALLSPIKDVHSERRLFLGRVILTSVVSILLIGVVVARLVQLQVVDYETTDFTVDVERYDFVFDAVGKSSYRECRGLLRPGGIFASTELGRYAQNVLLVPVTRFFGKTRVRFAFPFHDQKMIEYLAAAADSGAFRPVIDRTYPFDQIVEAHEYVDTGQKVGNVVVTV